MTAPSADGSVREWAQDALDNLSKASPTALKVRYIYDIRRGFTLNSIKVVVLLDDNPFRPASETYVGCTFFACVGLCSRGCTLADSSLHFPGTKMVFCFA